MHFALYLALYSLGQLALFAWRDNVLVLGPLKQAQVTALVVLIALLPIALILRRAGVSSADGRMLPASALSDDHDIVSRVGGKL